MTGVTPGAGTTYPLRSAWRVSHLEQALLTLWEQHDGCHTWSRHYLPFESSWVHPSVFICVMFCGSLFVLLFFLPFDDFRVHITSLWYVETVFRTEERRLGTYLDIQCILLCLLLSLFVCIYPLAYIMKVSLETGRRAHSIIIRYPRFYYYPQSFVSINISLLIYRLRWWSQMTVLISLDSIPPLVNLFCNEFIGKLCYI